jgi:hypothetical protein
VEQEVSIVPSSDVHGVHDRLPDVLPPSYSNDATITTGKLDL